MTFIRMTTVRLSHDAVKINPNVFITISQLHGPHGFRYLHGVHRAARCPATAAVGGKYENEVITITKRLTGNKYARYRYYSLTGVCHRGGRNATTVYPYDNFQAGTRYFFFPNDLSQNRVHNIIAREARHKRNPLLYGGRACTKKPYCRRVHSEPRARAWEVVWGGRRS